MVPSHEGVGSAGFEPAPDTSLGVCAVHYTTNPPPLGTVGTTPHGVIFGKSGRNGASQSSPVLVIAITCRASISPTGVGTCSTTKAPRTCGGTKASPHRCRPVAFRSALRGFGHRSRAAPRLRPVPDIRTLVEGNDVSDVRTKIDFRSSVSAFTLAPYDSLRKNRGT